MVRYFSLLIFMVLTTIAYSQSGVKGLIKDSETQERLAGANILVEGTTKGTSADRDGSFSLYLQPGKYNLIFSFIGYSSSKISVEVQENKTTELEVVLKSDPFKTEEIVVTGQGVGIRRERISTVTQTITSEQLEKIPAPRLENLLQSAIPNAQIQLRSGQAGGTSNIRTRGANSAFKSSTPVIYVDGIRVDNMNSAADLSLNISGSHPSQGVAMGSISDIPTENIERIEYINGGAATTLYGSDAANGVIQIFTKEGIPGRSTLNYETRLGFEVGTSDYFYFDKTSELLYRPGFTQEHLISGSGGTNAFTYSFGASVNGSEGFRIDNSRNTSYSLRTTFSAKLWENINYISSFGFNRSSFDRYRNGNAGSYAPIWLLEGGAILPVFGFENDIDNLDDSTYNALKSFVSDAEALQDFNYSVNRFQTSQKLEFTPLAGLRFHLLTGLDYRNSKETGYITSKYLSHIGSTNTDGSIYDYERKYTALTLEAAGSYTYNFNDFSVISSLGGQLFRTEDEQFSLVGTEVRDGAKTINQAGEVTSNQLQYIVANYGFYFLQNLGWNDKVFLEYGIRADGNSAFGDDIGLQWYPKVGTSVVLSNFNELSGIKSFVPYFRIRANYGVAGNFPPPFISERTVSFFSYQDNLAAGFGIPGNADLKPEKTATFEIGTDLSFFEDKKLSLGFTYYNAKTTDALFIVPAAPSSGEADQYKNVGEIENKGVEISLNLDLYKSEDFSASLNASYNTLTNVVTNTGGAAPFAIGGFSSRTIQAIVEEGQPVGYLRGTKTVIDGDEVTVEQLAFLGKTQPDYFGSITLNVNFLKRFNFYATADYQVGGMRHDFNTQFRYLYGVDASPVPESQRVDGASNWLDVTNFFVEKTDFMKIRLITLSYDIPEEYYKQYFSSIQVGFSISNPLNFYSASFDPEADGSAARAQGSVEGNGASYGVESAPRTYLASIKIGF